MGATSVRSGRTPGIINLLAAIAMAAWPTLNLTSVAQDMEAIGKEAAQMVLKLVSRPNAKVEPSVLPPRLVVRGSSKKT